MMGKLIALAASSALAFTVGACSQETAASAKEDMGSMETSAPAATAGPIRSTGTVTAVNAAAGTISLDHEATAAISWPAMSMQIHGGEPGHSARDRRRRSRDVRTQERDRNGRCHRGPEAVNA